MMRRTKIRNAHNGQQGYALLLILFLLAVLALSTVAMAPTIISSVQREKEKEMVWRGRQYTRGVRMYYTKMKRFPTSLDDLTKPKTGLRFMRQAYKDPMNATDGSWRLIYVGPNGQLIGSLNPQNQTTFGMFGAQANALGAQAGALGGNGLGGNGNSFGSSFGTSSFGNSSFGNSNSGNNSSFANSNSSFGNGNNNAAGNSAQGPGNMSGVSTDPNAQNSGQLGTPQSLGVMDSSNTIGGNIIGVGSKIDKKSFLWYQKAKIYKQFEFIWDPSKDMGVGGASRGIGTGVQNMNGATPAGANGTLPGPNGGQNPQNPQPNPQQNQNLNGIGDPTANPPLQAPPPGQ
jgi:type II secretory pathway pseudopilin PulG